MSLSFRPCGIAFVAPESESNTAPSWIVQGLQTLVARASNIQEGEALAAATVAFQASRFEEGLRRIWAAVEGGEDLEVWERKWRSGSHHGIIHSKAAAWAHAVTTTGGDLMAYPFQRGSNGKANLPSDYGGRYLTHEEFFSCLMALRNTLVHAGPPGMYDRPRLERLQELNLPHDLLSIDQDFLDEISLRLKVFEVSYIDVIEGKGRRALPS